MGFHIVDNSLSRLGRPNHTIEHESQQQQLYLSMFVLSGSVSTWANITSHQAASSTAVAVASSANSWHGGVIIILRTHQDDR